MERLERSKIHLVEELERDNRGLRIKNTTGRIGWMIFRSIFLIGICFIILYPLIYMLSIAFRSGADMANPSVVWIPKHYTMEAVADSFKAMEYLSSLWNTIRLGFVSSLLQVVSCAIVGYGFARFEFKGKGLFFALAIFTILVPPSVVYVPTYLSYRSFDYFGIGSLIGLFTGKALTTNLLNSALTLYIPAFFGVGIRSGLFIFIFRQFYRGLPRELEDAAYIDGCGFVRTFIRVILPNAKTSLLTVFLFSVVWYWNDYYYVSMYFTNVKTISTALATLRDLLSIQEGMAGILNDTYLISTRMQAGSLLAVVPLLIMYIFLQKHFTEGIERTGLVG